LIDLSGSLIKTPIKIFKKNILNDFAIDTSQLANSLKSSSNVTIVIDIGCSESVAFFTKIIPKIELNKDKLSYIVVTPTIKTHQNFSTTLSSLYRLLIVTNQLANDNVNFVERSFWYGNGYSTTETFKSTLVNINEAKATSNFHPGGPAT
jgi:hypothetical protein